MKFNLKLFGIDYLSCDICGEGFPDVIDYFSCDECGRSFCCEECAEEARVKFKYYNCDGDVVIEGEDYDYREVCSCKFCRKEDFDEEELLKFALSILNLTEEELKEKLREATWKN